ncbi:LacI family transcriptional regulator [Cellulosimicrobium cellulans]|uniref:LacI family transcriptional regulator n=1 Tax=Cellulosimicrobium cellulans TaxID=1710 RepID=A0A1Y0HXU1_CELCE|nr:LacI family DNA-binding transcriptional regulator [Cellulosimicrobium cellulans]ARU52125.1 LacI family transcriptional regulator [Cellulosimicrobium cellulans]MBM7818692.1 LacI family transcriptional regulator [Cellulosimicrobium cellulans]
MVTVRDVARESGVSISTVSRALAEPERVAPETRDRVVAVANRLGYRPNRAASGLRAGRTGALGLVVPDLENPYFASVTKGVQARARQTGHAVFVVDAGEDPALETELVTGLRSQTDGLVLCSPRAAEADLDAARDAPVVLVNLRHDGVPSVSSDDAHGVVLAVEHLRALGHRRVAYVGGPDRSWSDARRRAGLDAVRERYPDVETVTVGSFRPRVEGGRAAADLVVASGATAVLAYNDLVALGLVARLRERGVDVPRDLSVVGFDDTFVATLASPPLTTVRTDLAQLGARAVDRLVAALGTRRPDVAATVGTPPEESADDVLPVELVVRDSTTLAPTGQPVPPR